MRENNLLQRKTELLKNMYEELNHHEFNVLTNEFEEPPKFYRDLTRLQIYKCVEGEKKKVASLKKQLVEMTDWRKFFELQNGDYAAKIRELKGQVLSARKESS